MLLLYKSFLVAFVASSLVCVRAGGKSKRGKAQKAKSGKQQAKDDDKLLDKYIERQLCAGKHEESLVVRARAPAVLSTAHALQATANEIYANEEIFEHERNDRRKCNLDAKREELAGLNAQVDSLRKKLAESEKSSKNAKNLAKMRNLVGFYANPVLKERTLVKMVNWASAMGVDVELSTQGKGSHCSLWLGGVKRYTISSETKAGHLREFVEAVSAESGVEAGMEEQQLLCAELAAELHTFEDDKNVLEEQARGLEAQVNRIETEFNRLFELSLMVAGTLEIEKVFEQLECVLRDEIQADWYARTDKVTLAQIIDDRLQRIVSMNDGRKRAFKTHILKEVRSNDAIGVTNLPNIEGVLMPDRNGLAKLATVYDHWHDRFAPAFIAQLSESESEIAGKFPFGGQITVMDKFQNIEPAVRANLDIPILDADIADVWFERAGEMAHVASIEEDRRNPRDVVCEKVPIIVTGDRSQTLCVRLYRAMVCELEKLGTLPKAKYQRSLDIWQVRKLGGKSLGTAQRARDAGYDPLILNVQLILVELMHSFFKPIAESQAPRSRCLVLIRETDALLEAPAAVARLRKNPFAFEYVKMLNHAANLIRKPNRGKAEGLYDSLRGIIVQMDSIDLTGYALHPSLFVRIGSVVARHLGNKAVCDEFNEMLDRYNE